MILLIAIIIIIILLFLLYQTNKIEGMTEHQYTPDELYQHLKFISETLTNNNIKHWITYGTLLGAIRNQDIIPYDYDFDLGANIEDTEKILNLNSFIKQQGYEIKKTYLGDLWKVSLKVYYNDIPMGDIYLYYKCKDNMMRRYDPNSGVYFWPKGTFPFWFIKDDVLVTKIRNTKFPIPKDSDILLEYFYGQTWRTPIKAKAQGGNGDQNSDYYGGALNNKLSFLIDHLKKKKIYLEPKLNEKVNIIIPEDQTKWVSDNELIYIPSPTSIIRGII